MPGHDHLKTSRWELSKSPTLGLPHTPIPPQMHVAELQIPAASALVRLAYLDSGVPLSGGDYDTTIITIHGLTWSAAGMHSPTIINRTSHTSC
jgi:hypothetical protein